MILCSSIESLAINKENGNSKQIWSLIHNLESRCISNGNTCADAGCSGGGHGLNASCQTQSGFTGSYCTCVLS
uniref:Uncharacterized protein n=1 Tax=Acrobeloides nanus TaxID=290746 RepID=A0A914CYF7_9BILA